MDKVGEKAERGTPAPRGVEGQRKPCTREAADERFRCTITRITVTAAYLE